MDDLALLSSAQAVVDHAAGLRAVLGARREGGFSPAAAYGNQQNDWVERNVAEVVAGKRGALVVVGTEPGRLWSRSDRGHEATRRAQPTSGVVGGITWKLHGGIEGVGELRNVAVHERASGQGVASMMLLRVHRALEELGCAQVIADSKIGHSAANRLLLETGYQPVAGALLYGDGSELDIMWARPVGRRPDLPSSRQVRWAADCMRRGRIPAEVAVRDPEAYLHLWHQLPQQPGRSTTVLRGIDHNRLVLPSQQSNGFSLDPPGL